MIIVLIFFDQNIAILIFFLNKYILPHKLDLIYLIGESGEKIYPNYTSILTTNQPIWTDLIYCLICVCSVSKHGCGTKGNYH